MPAPDFTDVTRLFEMLSDATRLEIMLLLAKGEKNVTNLCAALKLQPPAVSHHLGILRMTRLVVGRKQGQQAFYALAPHIKVVRGKIKIAVPPHTVTIEGA